MFQHPLMKDLSIFRLNKCVNIQGPYCKQITKHNSLKVYKDLLKFQNIKLEITVGG